MSRAKEAIVVAVGVCTAFVAAKAVDNIINQPLSHSDLFVGSGEISVVTEGGKVYDSSGPQNIRIVDRSTPDMSGWVIEK